MKKRVDERVRQVLTRAYESHTRALFFVIGDHARDQVPFFYHLLTRIGTRPRPDVLWMYKKELGFSSHRRKRLRQLRRLVRRGHSSLDPSTEDLFELFVSTANIRFTYYAESEKVLGNTYGLLVLQDFEALTPNTLARTIETVHGGGLVLFLLHTMESLRQLYTLKMDIHAHFRTESCQDLVPRFNRRLVLSLEQCPVALALDDELNILPAVGGATCMSAFGNASNGHAMSRGTASDSMAASIPVVTHAAARDTGCKLDPMHSSEAEHRQRALGAFWDTVSNRGPLSVLVRRTMTLDQAQALERLDGLLKPVSGKQSVAKLRAALAVLTAARGRGKSAALGLATALALAHGSGSIVVTAPAPDNLQTFFTLLLQGLNDLGYREHLDFTLESQRDRFITRITLHRDRLQQVRYIQPEAVRQVEPLTSGALVSADLLIIDEAAAIPLVLVKRILSSVSRNSCHVFLSSTVLGYEGTGRSLSLKLVEQARQHARLLRDSGGIPSSLPSTEQPAVSDGVASAAAVRQDASPNFHSPLGARQFFELTLDEPIRYARGDPVEAWLYALLCLETTQAPALHSRALAHPSSCELFEVNRDVLFSGHPVAEAFLHRVMALFVSSHYKNSPNDLQMLSDAPNQRLFVLLSAAASETTRLPDVLCAIQLGLEGRLSSEHTRAQLSRGKRSAGDLIPWTVSQQFQEPAFAQLAGARVIRIATHPDAQGMGYGTRAMECLLAYTRATTSPSCSTDTSKMRRTSVDDAALPGHDDNGVGTAPEPLLWRLVERRAAPLDYIGVSFGLSHGLYRFWNRLGLLPVYIRLTANEITAEHTCIMVKGLKDNHEFGIKALYADWRTRFLSLLAYDLRSMSLGLALDLLRSGSTGSRAWSIAELSTLLSMHDLQRMNAYAQHSLDYHVILDLIPTIARLYFEGRFASEHITLSPAQQAILLGMGLQHRSVDDLSVDMGIESAQLLAIFGKICRKFANEWKRLAEEAAGADLPLNPSTSFASAQRTNGAARVSKANDEDAQTKWNTTGLCQTIAKSNDVDNGRSFAQDETEAATSTGDHDNGNAFGRHRSMAPTRVATVEATSLNADCDRPSSVISLPATSAAVRHHPNMAHRDPQQSGRRARPKGGAEASFETESSVERSLTNSL
jgi:N-acetyltransferase 10